MRRLGISLPSTLFPLAIGPMRTKMMMFTGDWISGAQAEAWGRVALAVQEGELDASVMTLAKRISLVPVDLLASVKRATNRAFDAIGVDQLVAAAVELDAIAHFSTPVVGFWRGAREEGLKTALKRREAPFEGNPLAERTPLFGLRARSLPGYAPDPLVTVVTARGGRPWVRSKASGSSISRR